MASFLVACSNQCGTILRSMVPELISLLCEQCAAEPPAVKPRRVQRVKPSKVTKKGR